MTYQEQMTAWVEILRRQERRPLYDFGWNLEHVTEPRDKRGNE
jgi:hypothetical protein